MDWTTEDLRDAFNTLCNEALTNYIDDLRATRPDRTSGSFSPIEDARIIAVCRAILASRA